MNRMKIFNKENIYSLKNLPPVSETMMYIYVIENSDSRIKIGKTTNPLQRIISLSGSNTGGSKIHRIACMENPTYILTLESTLHSHFNTKRIKGTEWFKDIKFNEVIDYIDNLLSSKSYDLCNELRKERLNKII